MPSTFGQEPLDSLDRQILAVVCSHGRDGQSFNKLVAEASAFSSRSTFALRLKRLERLGYIEGFSDQKNPQMKRTRGKPMTLLVMRIVSRVRSQCKELEKVVHERAELLASKTLTKDELDSEMVFINETNDKVKSVFSLIGIYAVNLGVSAASDLLLPMVIEDFKRVNSGLGSLLVSNPELLRVMTGEKLSTIPLDQLKDDFKYAFGTEMDSALPIFSNRIKNLTKPGRS